MSTKRSIEAPIKATNQDGSGGVDETLASLQKQVSELSLELKQVKARTCLFGDDVISIDGMIDDISNQLSPEKILDMKLIKSKGFELDLFKEYCNSNISTWKEFVNVESKTMKIQDKAEQVIDSIIAYACSQFMMSMSLNELQEKEAFMYLCDVVNDVIMNTKVDVRATITMMIKKQRLKNESYKLVILTNEPDKNAIRGMSFKELRKQILEDAYIIIWRNWNSPMPNMEWSVVEYFIHNIFNIKLGNDNAEYEFPKIKDYISNAGIDAIFQLAENHEFMDKIVGSAKTSKKNKDGMKTDKSKKDEVQRDHVKFRIPKSIYRLMSVDLRNILKTNDGNASKVSKEQLAKEPSEVVEYVKSLKGAHNLSNV